MNVKFKKDARYNIPRRSAAVYNNIVIDIVYDIVYGIVYSIVYARFSVLGNGGNGAGQY